MTFNKKQLLVDCRDKSGPGADIGQRQLCGGCFASPQSRNRTAGEFIGLRACFEYRLRQDDTPHLLA